MISYADFIVLAGITAIEHSLPFGGEITLPFKYGRIDGTTCSVVDAGRLPEAVKSSEHVVEVFADRMGLSLRDITALMGAHTLGRAQDENSGYNGPWDNTQARFDNEYYAEMVEKPWRRQERTVNGVVHHDWIVPPPPGRAAGITMMLNTDMTLAFEIGDSDADVLTDMCCVGNGGGCRNQCPAQNLGTRQYVDSYITSQEAWFADFAAGWTTMTELGWEGKLLTPSGPPTLAPVAPINPAPATLAPVAPVTPAPVAPVAPVTPTPVEVIIETLPPRSRPAPRPRPTRSDMPPARPDQPGPFVPVRVPGGRGRGGGGGRGFRAS